MGKQENVVLSVEAIKEIFRDLFKGQEQTLLTIIDGIPEYKEDSWDDTKELLKGALRKKMDANKIKIETAHRVAAK